MPVAFKLDHISLLVRSLAVSTEFYTGVLGLQQIENGTRQPNIRWFGFDGHDALHVTEADFGDTRLRKPTHFALCVTNFDAVVADFRSRGVAFFDWPGTEDNVTARPDGFRQIYLQDPDGYWIEINDHA
jgi:lactoylglutathione lyase